MLTATAAALVASPWVAWGQGRDTAGSPDGQAPVPPGRPGPVASGRSVSRWVPTDWAELPGFAADTLVDAWNAWVHSCARPAAPFAALCPAMRRLALADDDERRAWLLAHLRPHRVEPLNAASDSGLLTAYFEPVLDASRERTARHRVPLHRPPAGVGAGAGRSPWFTREQIDTLPAAQAALAGRELVWLESALDALIVHIQGSARLRVREGDGRERSIRVAFAGSNDHPYRSVGAWLLQQGELRDASWPAIRAWAERNPERQDAMLWSNPRYVFFRELPLDALQAGEGPIGAQGVPLTAGRSIAVDPQSIPYGTPVWLASPGPTLALQRLVIAQDTGSAIRGPIRADYFVGSGAEAGETAGRLRQSLRMWALWPV